MTPKETIIKFLEDQNFTIYGEGYYNPTWSEQMLRAVNDMFLLGNKPLCYNNVALKYIDDLPGLLILIGNESVFIYERVRVLEYCDPKFFEKLKNAYYV